ncbi:MAG: hypothetical protein ACXAC7_24420, partial [Candidatus Hodarchaeales archaeon]
QTEPKPPFLFNYGGFTDGDRCIATILDWYPNVKVGLLGFTFGSIQGKFSKPFLKESIKASTFKIKKLEFAKYFISSHLAKQYFGQIFNFSNPTDHIEGVSRKITSF